jgi:hypothetical protein
MNEMHTAALAGQDKCRRHRQYPVKQGRRTECHRKLRQGATVILEIIAHQTRGAGKKPEFRYLQQLFALFFTTLKYFCHGQKWGKDDNQLNSSRCQLCVVDKLFLASGT